jgi:preprotein translocase subunit SecF
MFARTYFSNFFSSNININFIKLRKASLIFSTILTLLTGYLLITNGIKFGIDFTGGALIEAHLQEKPNVLDFYKVADELKINGVQIQDYDGNNIMIKMGGNALDSNGINVELLKNKLLNKFNGEITFRKTEFVGPQIGSQLIWDSLLAVFFSFVAILLYVTYRFKFHYGVGIVLALLHDVVITIGFISLVRIEFDLTSVAAILTIIGYSVNDSVVIYDRIRENLRKYGKKNIDDIINQSINDTLNRTTLTVSSTLVAVLALVIYGGPALYGFSVIIFFGIIIGTFSSIFISAPILTKFKNVRI